MKKAHPRSVFASIALRYKEEFLVLSNHRGYKSWWVALDDMTKVPLYIGASSWHKPSGFFMSDQQWDGLDHSFPIASKMLLATSGLALCGSSVPAHDDLNKHVLDRRGSKHLPRPKPIHMSANLRWCRRQNIDSQTHANDLHKLLSSDPRLQDVRVLGVSMDNGPDYSPQSAL
eukprot:10216889-Karenia_brevis.AAC.1